MELDVTEYSRLGVVELADVIRQRRLSRDDVRSVALEALSLVEPEIHAVEEVYASVDVDETTDRATLRNVPTFRKDLGVREAGRSYEMGSRTTRGSVSDTTDEYWVRLRDEGVFTLGRSRTAEFGANTTVEVDDGSPVANPWNTRHSSGGSSGGAAALVAAGVVPFAHANDSGGSIRIPAAHCGLVGLKPSRGMVPRRADAPTTGIVMASELAVTRSVSDTVALFEIVTRSSVPREDPGPLRVGFSATPWLDGPLDAETAALVQDAARELGGHGHDVEEFVLDVSAQDYFEATLAFTSAGTSRMFEMARGERDRDEELALLNNYARLYVEHGRTLDLDAERAAEEYFLAVSDQLAALFDRFDVIVTPTTAQPAPELGVISGTHDTDVREAHERRHRISQYATVFNMSGLPAGTVPAGLNDRGLPLGVQVVGRMGEDALVLQTLGELEREFGQLTGTPAVHVSTNA